MSLPLARSAVDRAARLRVDQRWLAEAWPTSRVLLVDTAAGGTAPIRDRPEGPVLVLVRAADAPAVDPADRLFLGVAEDGVAVFALDVRLASPPPPPAARLVSVRDVGHLLSDHDAGLFTAAVALANWHARHPYSPATGELTTVIEGGWARREPDGRQVWPRTDPAVITVVHDGVAGLDGRCLLGHNGVWRQPGARRFSCLAGFVEAGESAEAAVAREVREEVGVEVGRITYAGSQSWPFPGSLMLGFTAFAEPSQRIQVDSTEIVEARWFSRREIAAVYSGQRVELGDGVALLLPVGSSIASYLITLWLREQPPAEASAVIR